jgi:hypothetical protein
MRTGAGFEDFYDMLLDCFFSGDWLAGSEETGAGYRIET